MEDVFVETTGLYIFTKEVILKRRSRISENPVMLEVIMVGLMDINNPVVFEIANAIHEGNKKEVI